MQLIVRQADLNSSRLHYPYLCLRWINPVHYLADIPLGHVNSLGMVNCASNEMWLITGIVVNSSCSGLSIEISPPPNVIDATAVQEWDCLLRSETWDCCRLTSYPPSKSCCSPRDKSIIHRPSDHLDITSQLQNHIKRNHKNDKHSSNKTFFI